ncbi:MAG: DUF167 domain-containing protein [Candidatus Aadella gelida]|nr:DUF167 domain-containing protein [Candidatus Aadella gelida]
MMKLEIKVFPKSKTEKVVRSEEIVKVYINAAPDKGKANKAVIDLLAKEYGVKKRDVTIIKGTTSRNKVIAINK